LPPEEDIHRVTDVGTDTAISIHVYGADIGKLGSSINHVFDDLPVRTDPGDARRVAWRR
jgi:predicted metal-dependent enzyme (double-stranded beta helix superfamily)